MFNVNKIVLSELLEKLESNEAITSEVLISAWILKNCIKCTPKSILWYWKKRFYKNEITGCELLTTLDQCLEILLINAIRSKSTRKDQNTFSSALTEHNWIKKLFLFQISETIRMWCYGSLIGTCRFVNKTITWGESVKCLFMQILAVHWRMFRFQTKEFI